MPYSVSAVGTSGMKSTSASWTDVPVAFEAFIPTQRSFSGMLAALVAPAPYFTWP